MRHEDYRNTASRREATQPAKTTTVNHLRSFMYIYIYIIVIVIIINVDPSRIRVKGNLREPNSIGRRAHQ